MRKTVLDLGATSLSDNQKVFVLCFNECLQSNLVNKFVEMLEIAVKIAKERTIDLTNLMSSVLSFF
jgi:hypothetical protein